MNEHLENTKEALSLAREYKRENEKLRERKTSANGWISCDDRLPETKDCYLVYGSEYDFFSGATFPYLGILQYIPKNKIWNTKMAITVTHWQPLPEPPKE